MISDPIGGIAASLGPPADPVPGDAGMVAAGTPDTRHFADLLRPEQAPAQAPEPVPAQPAAPDAETGAVRLAPPGSGTTVGDAVLGGLQRFGRAVQSLDAMGNDWKRTASSVPAGGSRLPPGPAAAPVAASGNPTPAAQGPQPDLQALSFAEQARTLWAEGMKDQGRMYGVAFEFELVEQSIGAISKSIKTLLTQGAAEMRRVGRAGAPLLLLALLAGCKADLYSRLGEREAVEMAAVLMRGGVDVDRVVAKDGTSTLRVEKARLPQAVSLLEASRYPRNGFSNLGEMFEQKGIVSSPTAERARFIYAMTQELSRTLSDMDGVLTARVHVVLPHNDPLRGGGRVRPLRRPGGHRRAGAADEDAGRQQHRGPFLRQGVGRGAPVPAAAGVGETPGWAPWLAALLIPAAGGGVLVWRRRQAGAASAAAADADAAPDLAGKPDEARPARPSLRPVA